MTAAAASRTSRRFVVAGAALLVCWQTAVLTGASRATLAVLGVHGFVVHVLLGKACALLPAYFESDLAVPAVSTATLPLTTVGVLGLAAWTAGAAGVVGTAGAVLWAAGVLGTLLVLAWTMRGNLTGRATGTGEANAHRRGVDRAANAIVPVALAYLAAGTYETVAVVTDWPAIAAAGLPAAVHLIAAGGALCLLFGVGFRLLPRFLVASPPRPLVGVVLVAGALAPALLVAGFVSRGSLFRAGAILEATAVVGFAVASLALFARSDRRRVGGYAVVASVLSGVAGVTVGLSFALGWVVPTPAVVLAHLRLNVLGLLGLAIVGVTFQFYPPTVGTLPSSDDRTALASIVTLAGGVWLAAGGRLAGIDAVAQAGAALGLLGAVLYAYLVASTLLGRSSNKQ